jgi:hypothetical protein
VDLKNIGETIENIAVLGLQGQDERQGCCHKFGTGLGLSAWTCALIWAFSAGVMTSTFRKNGWNIDYTRLTFLLQSMTCSASQQTL